ncbi:porin family protein [Parabacteroides pacaensis]|uniref:porin family protein n=1 Tax=Parabacteroides pacaensis TaxID=2086575 RepID=UPI000D104B8C|nr:porin family protein [Parabacteroides pacaensis]
MKKKLFILAIGVFLSMSSTFAQVKVDRGYGNQITKTDGKLSTKRHGSALAIKYGVKAGVNLSNMSNDMTFDPNFSMGTGFRLGALVNLHWGQRTASSLPGTGLWGLQPEVLFSNQVIKSDEEDIKLNYIQVPVMMKVYPLSALSFEVGPEFSYLFSSSPESIKVNGANVKVGDCKGFNFGVGVGAAYEFNFGLMVGARYSIGFTDLAKNLKWKNNSNIQLTVGWLF